MFRRLVLFLRANEGGIATYVAQAVMILAVLSVAFLIVGATSNLGHFLVERIYDFIENAAQ
ncbi:MAG: hypothetical protein ACM3XM_06225 [Mycobacterium leprae]